jgi:cell cycle arrest protein BUB3
LLLASSWDTHVRLYDTARNDLRATFTHQAAVLDCCFAADESGTAYSGSVDCRVQQIDLATGSMTQIGAHGKPVKSVIYSSAVGNIFSGGWDRTVNAWDPRAPGGAMATLRVPGKVFTMSLSGAGMKLVVGTAGRAVSIYDIRMLAEPEQLRESSLKYQTRCIACAPHGEGYALGSIEGRIALEYFDTSAESQARKYAFKCHRTAELVYPVNTIAFHPAYGTFASGGCDGMVYIWDGNNKKRLSHLEPFETSISALEFNSNGSKLAIAASYTFEEGEKEHPDDAIHIHPILDHEVRPKARKAAP